MADHIVFSTQVTKSKFGSVYACEPRPEAHEGLLVSDQGSAPKIAMLRIHIRRRKGNTHEFTSKIFSMTETS